jgi:S1-C subfamily serine protease
METHTPRDGFTPAPSESSRVSDITDHTTVSSWPPVGPDPRPRAGGRGRGFLVGALVGGVVGALVAGGVLLAFDDGGQTTTVVHSTTATPAVINRPAAQIGGESDVAAIIQKAEPAIVAITTNDGPGSGTGGAGTGFVITDDGYVVTNNHVAEGANKIEVAFTNGDTKSAKIVGTDPSTDLAVLKVDGAGLPSVQLGDSDAAQVGDEVVAIGNALALEGGLSVTRGIISGTDRTVDTNTGASLVGMLQTDAAINPGNSGGPLLDADGKVLGINTAIANPQSAQNVGFAIPISRARPVIEDLRLGRKPAFLGITTVTVNRAAAKERGLAVDSGAYVSAVTPGTPAADAGVKQGDVIVKIGDTSVLTSADVQTAVRTHRPGDSVTVVVNRDGKQLDLPATLAQRPDQG